MKQISAYFLAICLLSGAGGSLAASDEALLEDLGADLLEPAPTKEVSPLGERLFEQLGDDVGTQRGPQNSELMHVVARMQEARALLERLQDSSRASAAQGQALTGLDRMIAELAEQKSKCSGGSCDKPSSLKPQKKPGNSGKPGKTAAAAEGTVSQSEEISPALGATSDLVKDLWGHLPERQREQILQPPIAEFLPQYATEIEAYFHKLAEPKK